LRIFGRNIPVVIREEHWNQDGGYNNAYGEVRLNGGLKVEDKWHTMWHEILELVYQEMDYGSECQERDIETTSFLLCTLFSQNDFSWVLEDNHDD
jgi:hypothetical protein